ncbi:unnamed protein product [Vicia faba]|uniref:Uncharacterized protein n=1 Tax=Vicia faba TaxID=3906 RepID=A0AAV0ZLE3_VICFA|nr:unnamed protein product [Vicia faba]
MASSSHQATMNIKLGKDYHVKPKTIKIFQEDLKLIMEQIFSFESSRANGYPLHQYFEDQGWMKFFDMLNGPTFPYLVIYFWVRVELYDEGPAALEKIVHHKDVQKEVQEVASTTALKPTKTRSGTTP